jgi:hypothetical protein
MPRSYLYPSAISGQALVNLPAILTAVSLVTATARSEEGQAIFDSFATRSRIDCEALRQGFADPPLEARLRVWWFWHAGLATKASITRDLEAMKGHGIGGALICDNGSDSTPQGPVFMSEEWKDRFAHAIREADRLGIEISLNIQSGAGDPGNPDIASDNGLKKPVNAETTVTGPGTVEVKLPMPPADPVFYQDVAVQAFRKRPGKLGNDAIRHWDVKMFETNDYNLDHYSDDFPDDGDDNAITPGEVIDLTVRFKDGVLRWDAPAGEWTVVRYGMTSTGKRNNYASRGFRGGLCYDPLNRRGVTAQWNDVAKPLIDIARRNGDSLKFVHLDSWEMKLCNWTQGFEEHFEKRRGYDMRPYFPVLAGRIVGSREISNRFLEDFRLTVADLAAGENYQVLRDLAHAEGIGLEFIHKQSADGEVDVYYVINKWARHGIDDLDYRYIPTLPDRFVNVTGSFRIDGGRVVERWDPVRGTITPVNVAEVKDGCHHLPVSLEPEGGAFYVFRKAVPEKRVTRITRDGVSLNEGNTPLEVGASGVFVRDGALEIMEAGRYDILFSDGKTARIDQTDDDAPVRIEGPWKIDFLEKPQLGEPFSATCGTLESWTDSANRTEKYFSGTARHTRTFPLDAALAPERRAYLNLGFVGDVATVRVNGRDVGTLWKPPYLADVTGFLKPGDNRLEVDVTNQWVNRLIGDWQLPPSERKTSTNLMESKYSQRLKRPDADLYLRASGLIGPVELRFSRIHSFSH